MRQNVIHLCNAVLHSGECCSYIGYSKLILRLSNKIFCSKIASLLKMRSSEKMRLSIKCSYDVFCILGVSYFENGTQFIIFFINKIIQPINIYRHLDEHDIFDN